jgi:hypothetical protein
MDNPLHMPYISIHHILAYLMDHAELLLLELFRLQLLQFSILVPTAYRLLFILLTPKDGMTYMLEKSKFVCLTPSASGNECM